MRRLLGALTTGALLLTICGTAQALTIQTSDASHPWQLWADQAQVPTWSGVLPFTVAAGYLDCGGMQAAGCSSLTPEVDQTSGQIMPQGTPLASVSTEVDGGQSAWDDRQTLYHELGQVFWAEYLTPSDQAEFMRIVGLGGDVSQWGNWLYGTRVIAGVTRHFPPFEWFAEGYRYCAEYGINQPLGVRDEEGLFYPGDQPGFASQQRQVCQLIDQVGMDHGIPTPAQAIYPAAAAEPKPTRPVKVARHVQRRNHGRIALAWGRRRVW
jgi:hypothetical protein